MDQFEMNAQRVAEAAQCGVSLLRKPGAVSVDGPTALSQQFKDLDLILSNLAAGLVVLSNLQAKEPSHDKDGE